MDHPPATDVVGSLDWIMDHLVELLRDRDTKRLCASEAARVLGFHERYFGKPWRIPEFGLHGIRHTLATWKSWLARPEAERRSEWDLLPMQSRRNARGAA